MGSYTPFMGARGHRHGIFMQRTPTRGATGYDASVTTKNDIKNSPVGAPFMGARVGLPINFHTLEPHKVRPYRLWHFVTQIRKIYAITQNILIKS